MLNEFLPKIPYGTKDLLPKEAKQKRELAESLVKLFYLWGYEETATPAFEYLETLCAGTDNNSLEYAFKFFDKNNRILALRTDMTTPIARVAATRLSQSPLPIRLFYIADVFRHEEAQAGRQCQFCQAGVELLGACEQSADAETIALAVNSMLNAGLKEFHIGLGQTQFANGLMLESQLDFKTQCQIKRAMVERDLVGLGEILNDAGLSPGVFKLLESIALMRGNDALENAYKLVQNDLSRQALDNLSEIYRLLVSYGVGQYVTFDLGIIRDFDYYTGLVFEGYTKGMGFPILGGGRYDNLLSSFGFDCPATGFSLGIERVLLALDRQGINFSPENSSSEAVYIAFGTGKLAEAMAAAKKYRDSGKKTKLAFAPQTKEEAEAYAFSAGRLELIYIT